MRRVSIGLVLAIAGLPGTGCADPVWPDMREFALSFGVDLSAHRNEADIPLYDVDGRIRYWLICRGDDREIDEIELMERRREGHEMAQNLYVPWWPFTCMLRPGARHPPEALIGGALDTLFAPLGTASRPYQTRAAFSGSDLLGACGYYPEFGRVRHFRLRGFELTLKFDPVTQAPSMADRAGYGVFHVSLRKYPAALTARAEPSGFLDPFRKAVPPQPRSCDIVLRGEDPASCYDPVARKIGACMREWAYEPESYEKHPYAIGEARNTEEEEKLDNASVSASKSTMTADFEDMIALVRYAAETRDGMALQPILPAFPFPLLCGKSGTREWASIRVEDGETWNRLWLTMLDDEAFRGFDHLMPREARLSPNYGVWIRGETFRFQNGVTIATSLSCVSLEQARE